MVSYALSGSSMSVLTVCIHLVYIVNTSPLFLNTSIRIFRDVVADRAISSILTKESRITDATPHVISLLFDLRPLIFYCGITFKPFIGFALETIMF